MAATKIITNAWKVRTLPDIFYEEPERIEDDMEQWPTVFRISGLLYERYRDRPDVFINGGGFVSYDVTDGNRRVAPDLFIAFDVDAAGIYENLPNFWIWEIRQGAGLRDGSGVAQHGGKRPGLETGAVPAAGDTGVLAV